MATPVTGKLTAEITQIKTTTSKQNVGVIREIGDGVAKVEGLDDAMLNEMIDLGHGITGLALNLEETEVGVIVLGDYTQLEEGDEVRATGKLLQVPVGKGLLGRVVNTLGQPVDGKGPIPRMTRPTRSRNSLPGSSASPLGQPAGANGHLTDRRDDPDQRATASGGS